MTDEMTAARVRVNRGARFLDEVAPGWENRIDLETLKLNDGMHCICGQVFAEEAKSETTDDPEATETGYSWAADHLFAQANAWVTAIVRLAPPNGKPNFENHDTYWDELTTWADRADRVATALGFDSGSFDGRAKSDQEYVTF